MMIPRYYRDLGKYLEPNQALIIYGPHQVGKTTLLRDYLSKTDLKYRLESGDNLSVQQILGSHGYFQRGKNDSLKRNC